MADSDPDHRTRVERAAQRVLRWIGRMLSGTLQRVLGVILVLGVVVFGGANAPAHVNPVLRWTLVAVIAVAGLASLALVWRSRTRAKLIELQRRNDALTTQVKTGDELRAVQAEEMATHAAERAAASRARVYGKLLDDVTNGLYDQLRNGGASGDELVRFIEGNSLKLINDTFAAELATDDLRPRIETGIARRTSYGFEVTHASGPFTADLKRDHGCYAGTRPIEEVLALKAAAQFTRDGWFVLPLTDTDPLQYFFMLSTVPPEDPEKEALKHHAALIKVTVAALTTADMEG